jgi:hypothetical protein
MHRNGLAVVAALLLAAGCGGGSSGASACDKVVQGYSDYSSKASGCGVNIPVGSFDRAACESAFNGSGCTAQDKQLWGDYGSCLSALPACTSGTSSAFVDAVVACTDKLSGLSGNCQ